MQGNHWQKAKSLFQAVVELDPSKREAFLDSECQDMGLRQHVRRLVELHLQDTDFLQSPMAGLTVPKSMDLLGYVGKQVADFRIVGQIGAGAMGVVYEVLQENPSRRAALKLLHPSRLSSNAVWRFQHESEILARLQHPGIAQVYSAGTTDFGHGLQPWFVMELIDGPPLHRYMAGQETTVAQKLAILLQVIEAVQHAHERGVIHRDLKPSNIMVSHDPSSLNSRPSGVRIKVVDFGIARIMQDQTDFPDTTQTAMGEILGTLNYMSPEQFVGDSKSIDQRSDIYALGAIGYEMLAGKLPLQLRDCPITEALQRITQQEPVLLGRISSKLRGDLEMIFCKALEKSLSRRYPTARDFAEDIHRYLRGEPVLARPASSLYRARKFVGRNRAIAVGTLSTFAALTLGMILYARQARLAMNEASKAKYEAQKAVAINDFITNDFLVKLLVAVQDSAAGERLPISQIVDRGAANVDEMFGGDPLMEAAVRNEIGTVYYNLGNFESAAEQYRFSLEHWQRLLGEEHPDTLKAVNNLGLSYLHAGQIEAGRDLVQRALQARTRVLGPSDPATLATINNLAQSLMDTNELDEAEKLFRQALHPPQVRTSEDKLTLTLTGNLGSLLAKRGQLDEATQLHQHVYDALQRLLGEDHATTLAAGSRLAQTLHKAGKFEEAKVVLLPVMLGFEQLRGPNHQDCITSHRLLARIYRDLDDAEAARNQLELAASAASGLPVNQRDALLEKIARELDALKMRATKAGAPQ